MEQIKEKLEKLDTMYREVMDDTIVRKKKKNRQNFDLEYLTNLIEDFKSAETLEDKYKLYQYIVGTIERVEKELFDQ